jgi:hypothetical protein
MTISERLAATLRRIRQSFCGLRGHLCTLQIERGRVALKCWRCEYETPGIAIATYDPGSSTPSLPKSA